MYVGERREADCLGLRTDLGFCSLAALSGTSLPASRAAATASALLAGGAGVRRAMTG